MSNHISALDLDATAELLRALAHGVRLELMRTLVGGERSVGEIEGITKIAQPGLSQQLAILRKADLVLTRREAKQVFYRLNQARIADVSALLDAFAGTVALSHAEIAAARLRSGGGAAVFARME
ncbi:hypothetical protein GCM10009087_26910 [Sphingomonas oligophenolica]